MGVRNRSSRGWRWVAGAACVILVIWILNHDSGTSPSSPTGNAEQAPPAVSTGVVPNAASSSPLPSSPRTFAGYGCASDCSGHEAGFNWAEEHDIDNEDDCDAAGDTSNSPSFAEGCKAYVNGDSPDEDDDDGDKPSDSDDNPQHFASI